VIKEILFDTHKFEVKNYILESQTIHIIVVEDTNTGQRYMFNQLFETVPYIEQLMTEENIVNLGDYTHEERGFFFSFRDTLILAFKYHDGLPLDYFLNHHKNNDEVLLNVLEQIIISAITRIDKTTYATPLIFDPRNIVVMPSKTVEINYALFPESTEDPLVSSDRYFQSLALIIDLVSAMISQAIRPEVTMICDKCTYGLYDSLSDVAYAVKELRTRERQGFLYRVKMTLRTLRRRLLPLVKLAFLLLVVYYGYTYIHTSILSRSSSIQVIGNYAITQDGTAHFQQQAVPNDHLVIQKESHQIEMPKKPEPPKPIPSSGNTVDYTIRAGDTLTKICLAHYGTTDYVMALAQYNALNSPNLIYPGNSLVLPSEDVLIKMME
jgi:LysM repeat protein